ncbi:hypothetical protein EV360DRAFT_85460 [Lentinula raphanica]|nr:hypothetical protein EV360DRAFT_85460 [Lentinula raphanica]
MNTNPHQRKASNSNIPSPSRTPRPDPKSDSSQLPPRPHTTAGRSSSPDDSTVSIVGTFFAGASQFQIAGGEFNHANGNMYKTIKNDHSTRSNFDNVYGDNLSGSGNRENNFNGDYTDNREFISQQYDSQITNAQFVGGFDSRRYYEQRSDYGMVHEPIPQRARTSRRQVGANGRSPTAPSMLESREHVRERKPNSPNPFDQVYSTYYPEPHSTDQVPAYPEPNSLDKVNHLARSEIQDDDAAMNIAIDPDRGEGGSERRLPNGIRAEALPSNVAPTA